MVYFNDDYMEVIVIFDDLVWVIIFGQVVVFYNGEECLGFGMIDVVYNDECVLQYVQFVIGLLLIKLSLISGFFVCIGLVVVGVC